MVYNIELNKNKTPEIPKKNKVAYPPPPPKQRVKKDVVVEDVFLDDFLKISSFIKYAHKDKIIDKDKSLELIDYLYSYLEEKLEFRKALEKMRKEIIKDYELHD